tara:strand:+ start:248 stop:463 length:216 start_codon:yes stop_codon:yes gene_type:complete
LAGFDIKLLIVVVTLLGEDNLYYFLLFHIKVYKFLKPVAIYLKSFFDDFALIYDGCGSYLINTKTLINTKK